jgi:hypothetical protein
VDGLKRKLLIVTDSLIIGGAERQLMLLAKYVPSEWDRRVLSLEGGPFAQAILSSGIQVDIYERKVQFDPRPAFDLRRLTANWRPDVVHSCGWMSCFAAIHICR